jgi:hypothetical protein
MNQQPLINALNEIRKIVDRAAPTPTPKTFGKHDFTGYSEEVITQSLDILDAGRTNAEPGKQSLPGPLAIVYRALESALATKAPKLPHMGTELRDPTKSIPVPTPRDKLEQLRGLIGPKGGK